MTLILGCLVTAVFSLACGMVALHTGVWLSPAWVLKLLRKRNFRLRAEGKLPDEWHWADVELIRRGKF